MHTVILRNNQFQHTGRARTGALNFIVETVKMWEQQCLQRAMHPYLWQCRRKGGQAR